MSHSKDPDTYDEFYHTVASLRDDELPLFIITPNRRAAESTRFRWYGFLGALRASRRPNARNAARLELTLTDRPDGQCELNISVRDQSLLAQAKAQVAAKGLTRTSDQLLADSLTPEEQARLSADLEKLSALGAQAAAPSTTDTILDILSQPTSSVDPASLSEHQRYLESDEWRAKVKLDTDWNIAIRMNREWDETHKKRGKTLRELLPRTDAPAAASPIDNSTPFFDYSQAAKPVDDK